jgi:hypothetical protein
MTQRRSGLLLRAAAGVLAILSGTQPGQAQTAPVGPGTVAAPPDMLVLALLHAQGAQIYDCRAGTDGRLAWQFREPVATLLDGGRTVGRHYAGPTWELADGSAILLGRVAGRLPGGGANDIPWLRLEIAERRGTGGGPLASSTAILRVNTSGGIADGGCPVAGALWSLPYAADYLFLAPRRGDEGPGGG